STIYHGHVFWDSDIWMFPALALTQPKRAETIANYRLLHRPTIGGFPWQSAISGRELAPAEFTKEKHVTGDVAFMLHQAAVLGLVPNEKAKEVGTYAANYFRSISVRSSD